MQTDREDEIRKRAYEIWEQEGRPEGREQSHWQEAERQLGAASPEGVAEATDGLASGLQPGGVKPAGATLEGSIGTGGGSTGGEPTGSARKATKP